MIVVFELTKSVHVIAVLGLLQAVNMINVLGLAQGVHVITVLGLAKGVQVIVVFGLAQGAYEIAVFGLAQGAHVIAVLRRFLLGMHHELSYSKWHHASNLVLKDRKKIVGRTTETGRARVFFHFLTTRSF